VTLSKGEPLFKKRRDEVTKLLLTRHGVLLVLGDATGFVMNCSFRDRLLDSKFVAVNMYRKYSLGMFMHHLGTANMRAETFNITTQLENQIKLVVRRCLPSDRSRLDKRSGTLTFSDPDCTKERAMLWLLKMTTPSRIIIVGGDSRYDFVNSRAVEHYAVGNEA